MQELNKCAYLITKTLFQIFEPIRYYRLKMKPVMQLSEVILNIGPPNKQGAGETVHQVGCTSVAQVEPQLKSQHPTRSSKLP